MLICFSFSNLYDIILNRNVFKLSAEYLILSVGFSQNNQTEIIEKLFDNFFKLLILNVHLITIENNGNMLDDGSSVGAGDVNQFVPHIYTYYPYTKYGCAKVHTILYNKFINGSFIEPTKKWFPNKLANLWRCPIKVAAFNVHNFMKLTPRINGSYLTNGFEGELLHALANYLNFSVEIVKSENQSGTIYPNKTFSGALQMVYNKLYI